MAENENNEEQNEENEENNNENNENNENSEEKKGERQVRATDLKSAETVVPDKYELTLPEESLLDSSITDEIAATAKERGLSNEDAQTMLEDRSKAIATHAESINKELDKTHKGWLEETKNDPDIGGDNFKETGELTFRAGEFLGKEFVELLDNTGLSNYITVVKAMRKLGEAMGDDKLILSKAKSGGGEEDKLSKFYDHKTSQPKEATG